MAFSFSVPSSKLLILLCFCLFYLRSDVIANVVVIQDKTLTSHHQQQQQQQLLSEALEWTTNTSSRSLILDQEEIEDLGSNIEIGDEVDVLIDGRRSLLWNQRHYYISYGALSANRVPCPPRSGRSYYTNNCYKSRAPAQPYSRGCSRITRCRR